jgi:hypothetical protein
LALAYAYLGAGVGTGKQDTGCATRKGSGLAWVAEVAQGSHNGLDGALLTEAGLGESQQGGNDSSLGVHDDGKYGS